MARTGTEDVSDIAPLFTALGDETRLHLVRRLCREGPVSISRLAEGSGVSRQAVSKHLRVLCDAGLARGERHGREHRWTLEGERLEDARRYLDRISAQWDGAIARLRSFVEDDLAP